ncbi:uncharacterized protein LOC110076964 isoform X5 [Pogona vitticeps]
MWGLFWALLLLLRLELPLGASPEEQCRQNTIGGVEGKDIALHPNVSGSPAEITWMKDRNIVATSIDGFPTKNNLELIVNNGSLILHNLSLKDVGCYKAEIEVKDEVTETFFGLKVLDHQIGGRSRIQILLAVIIVVLMVIGSYVYLIKATDRNEGGICPNAKYDPMPSPEGGNISDNQPDVNLDSAEKLEGSREESSPPES